MNISENILKENGKKKMKRFLLGKIEGRGIGISAKKQQIKTTAKKSFLFFCSSLMVAMGTLCPMAISVSAEAVGPLPEGFNDVDLSDILITFPAGAGAAIKNETVLNDLYSNYGVSGWGVGDMTPYFDIVVSATGESAGLSNDVLNEHLGDNDWFQQNGYDIKVNYESFKQKLDNTESLTQYGANFIHQATLSPSTGNPWEWDWSSILEEYFRTGLIAFEHVFMPFEGLNAVAVTMDDVLQNIYNYWIPNIDNAEPITTNINMPNGYSSFAFIKSSSSAGSDFYYNRNDGVYLTSYINSSGRQTVAVINTSDSVKSYQRRLWTSTGGYVNPDSYTINSGTYSNRGYYLEGPLDIPYVFQSTSELNTFIQNVKNGEEDVNIEKFSPDLINPNGNISIEDYPSMSPSIEQGQAIRPIPQEGYQNWAQTNNLADPAENGALMGALVTPYIENAPAPAPSPAPDDPWADPVPDTEPANRPVSPDQPQFPEEPELTDEEVNESLLGATPDLTEIFPFCIPWDIARILKHFTANRRAPYIEWTFESDLFGFSYTFEIDMSIFDDVAVVLRLLELAGFILGLAILTRYLIGAN